MDRRVDGDVPGEVDVAVVGRAGVARVVEGEAPRVRREGREVVELHDEGRLEAPVRRRRADAPARNSSTRLNVRAI